MLHASRYPKTILMIALVAPLLLLGRVDAENIKIGVRQTEGITKEIPADQVFDFSYLPVR